MNLMSIIDHYLTFDMLNEMITSKLWVRRSDSSHRMYIRLTQGGNDLTLDPDVNIVQFLYTRPDGQNGDCECGILDDGRAAFTLPAYALYVSGELKCQIRVYTSGDDVAIAASPEFIVTVCETIEGTQRSGANTVYDQIVANEAQRQLTLNALYELLRDIAASPEPVSAKLITDDDDNTKVYKLGVKSGALYIEEVT